MRARVRRGTAVRMRLFLWLTGLLVPVLAIFPHLVSTATVRWMLLEDGLLETVAMWLWLAAALLALLRSFPPRLLLISYAMVFAALSLRESGVPTAILSGGKQALRMSYYLGDAPLGQRLMVGAFMVCTLLALIHAIWGSLRNLRAPREFDREEQKLLFFAGAILAISQVFEAAQDWVSWLGALAQPTARSFWSIEEGLEALAPLLLMLALMPRRWPWSKA